MARDIKTVTAIVQQYIADVQKAMPIDKVYLYGSYAKGTQSEKGEFIKRNKCLLFLSNHGILLCNLTFAVYFRILYI
jgi:hypothetical protein